MVTIIPFHTFFIFKVNKVIHINILYVYDPFLKSPKCKYFKNFTQTHINKKEPLIQMREIHVIPRPYRDADTLRIFVPHQ